MSLTLHQSLILCAKALNLELLWERRSHLMLPMFPLEILPTVLWCMKKLWPFGLWLMNVKQRGVIGLSSDSISFVGLNVGRS